MKKFISTFILSLLLLTHIQNIQANPFTTRLTSTSTSIEAGQSFTVTFEVRGSTGLCGLTSNLNFDTNKLEITSSSSQNGFALTLGTKMVADREEAITGNFNVARLTFKAKSGFIQGESTQISISNIVGSDCNNDVSGTGSNITINLVPPKSTNNFLENLETNVGSINFSKNTLSYTLIVDNSVTSANITGAVEDSKATVSGLGNKSLSVYSNAFNITVTAESGATRRYTLNIIRRDESGNAGALSNNNALKSLTLDVCNLNFSADILNYACEVDNLVEAFILGSEVEDNKASVSRTVPDKLSLGLNTLKLTVTAESGETRVYTITITRSTSTPTVSIDKLEEALKTLTSDEVGIDQPEDGIIPQHVLSLIKKAEKTLIVRMKDSFGNTLYEWYIDGSKANPAQPIKTKIMFENDLKSWINQETNFAQGLILDFEKNPNLPMGTKVKLYLNESLSQFPTLNLYYFNPDSQKLELKHEALIVEENYIWIPLEHTSDYFLTPSMLSKQSAPTGTSNTIIWIGLSLTQFAVILIFGFLLLKRKKQAEY